MNSLSDEEDMKCVLPKAYNWRKSFVNYTRDAHQYWMPSYETPNYELKWSDGPLSARRIKESNHFEKLSSRSMPSMSVRRLRCNKQRRRNLANVGRAMFPFRDPFDSSREERAEVCTRRSEYAAVLDQAKSQSRQNSRRQHESKEMKKSREKKEREKADLRLFKRAVQARFEQDLAFAALRAQVRKVGKVVGELRKKEKQEGKQDRLRRRKVARARAQRQRYHFNKREKELRLILTDLERREALRHSATAAKIAAQAADMVSKCVTPQKIDQWIEQAKEVRRIEICDMNSSKKIAFSIYSPQVERLFRRIMHGKEHSAWLKWKLESQV
eukprot:g6252.t1